MKRSKFIENVAARSGYTKENIERMLDAFQEEIIDLLINGDKLMLKGFLIFETVIKPARKGKHPVTNEIVLFPEKKSARVKMSKKIKKIVGDNGE